MIAGATSALLVCGLFAPPATAATPAPATGTSASASGSGISAVSVDAETVTVTGSVGVVGEDSVVRLLAVGAESSATVANARLLGTVTPDAEGAFALETPRFDGDGADLLYSRYFVTVDDIVVGAPHFADDLRFEPANTSEYPVAVNKKGLQVQMTDDAESLGVQHAGINVDLAEIMFNTKTSDADIVFESGGDEYYFDSAAVNALDTQIKAVSDNGTLVNLIVLVYRHDDEPNSAANILIHPDASREAGAGPVFGFNTVTEEGIRYMTAAMEFIASRWSHTDERFGKVVGFIVGNEVDAQWAWSNSGEKTVDEFLDDYARALRIMSLASRNFYSEARTYTSLTHAWTVGAGSNPDPANPTRFYAAKDVLDKLNTISKTTGDFPWFVAQHPYPQDLFKPDFWNDTRATDALDTELITFKNLQVLPRYLASEELLYEEEPRRIILSEQGCNTPGEGDSLTLEAEKLQAACYAYAYYKIRFLPSIDNFILHRHVDHRVEGGLNLGLWAADYSTDFPAAPLRQKYIYDVFKYIDTERSLEVTEFAKDIIGIDDWSDVIDGFDPAVLDERSLTETVGSRVGAKTKGDRAIGAFATDADGWSASDNVSSVSAETGVLHVTGAPNIFASQWRGIVKEFTDAAPHTRNSWLTASLRIPANTALGAETVARITATLSTGEVIEGDARFPADGSSHTVAIPLPKHGDATLARAKVRVRGEGTAQPDSAFDVQSISLAKGVKKSSLPNVLISASTDTADLTDSTLTVSITNLDTDTLRGRVAVPDECGDFDVEGDGVRIRNARFGDTVPVEYTVAAVRGEAANLCIEIDNVVFELAVEVPPPTENLVFDFETDTEGWVSGDNVETVTRVTSILNGPWTPRGGTAALEAKSAPVPAAAERSVSVTPDAPVDLSEAKSVFVWMNSWGGVPGATGYVATLTLTAADGSQVETKMDTFQPDSWNELSIDVSAWEGRSAVASMEVSFAAVGSDYPGWDPRFQLDDLGYFTSVP